MEYLGIKYTHWKLDALFDVPGIRYEVNFNFQVRSHVDSIGLCWMLSVFLYSDVFLGHNLLVEKVRLRALGVEKQLHHTTLSMSC